MTALGRYAVQVGVDMTIDTGINAVTGNLSWENFGTSLAMSLFLNKVTAHPRIQTIQHGFTSRGYGMGYSGARSARGGITGVGARGSAGAITTDIGHVATGDTAGPNSPYAGNWDMAGGGHIPGEIRPRANAEGITRNNVATDPITGVAIDRFQRPARNNAGPMLDAAGNPVMQSKPPKSQFPEGMNRAQVERAGQIALEHALAGTPHTRNEAPSLNPNGTPKNGKFSAIVTTPQGHPITVEGYYRPGPGGVGWEITTVYPKTDPTAGVIPAVGGSRFSVPGGVVTPPDYDYGDQ
jgi:hypothetical protein